MEENAAIMTPEEWAEYIKKYGYDISYEVYVSYAQHVVEEWNKYEREI